MAVKLKRGVRIVGLRPEMVMALMVANGVYARFKVDCVVTSGVEGMHSTHSRHYMGCALDFRIRDLPRGQHVDLHHALADALGPDFNVLLEGNHIHVGLRPRQLGG